MLNARQFQPPQGDEGAKKALLKQLKKDFPKEALTWLKDERVTVEGPSRIPAGDIDWDDYPEWRASKQLETVVQVAKKKIDKGKGKPAVMARRPHDQDLLILDGHHHTMARVDHKENPLAFVVNVPHDHGPWDDLHDKQIHDTKKDDFGKTPEGDRDH